MGDPWELSRSLRTKLENGRTVGIVTFTSYEARKWENRGNCHVHFVRSEHDNSHGSPCSCTHSFGFCHSLQSHSTTCIFTANWCLLQGAAANRRRLCLCSLSLHSLLPSASFLIVRSAPYTNCYLCGMMARCASSTAL
jgi:hypothetical protein